VGKQHNFWYLLLIKDAITYLIIAKFSFCK
jgi:hypothetical protein